MNIYRSYSSEETKQFGELLAEAIILGKSKIEHRERALVVALQGDLGQAKQPSLKVFLRASA